MKTETRPENQESIPETGNGEKNNTYKNIMSPSGYAVFFDPASCTDFETFLQLLPQGTRISVHSVLDICSSLKELLQLSRDITSKGFSLRSEKESWFVLTPEAPTLLEHLEQIDELQRSLSVRNTKEGLSKARAKGKKLGRPKGINKETEEKLKAAAVMYQNSTLKVGEICHIWQLPRRALYHYLEAENIQTRRKSPKE